MDEGQINLGIFLKTVLYGFLAIVTIVGNLLVVIAFFQDKSIRKKLSNYFIVNLAFADLFCGVFIFALKFGKSIWVSFQPREVGTWPFGENACVIWLISGTCLIYSSLCTVVVISYDRFLLVKDAITYTVTTTRRRVLKIISAIWTVAISYSITTNFLKYFGFRKIKTEVLPVPLTESANPFINETNITVEIPVLFSPSGCNEDTYSSVTSYTAFIAFDFVVFFCVLAITNSCVCLKLQQRARKGIFEPTDGPNKYRVTQDKVITIDASGNHNDTSMESESKNETDKSEITEMSEGSSSKIDKKNGIALEQTAQIDFMDEAKMYSKQVLHLQKSRKAVKSLTVLVAAFVICWCPYYFVAILYHSGLVLFPDAVIDAVVDLIWVNSTINPFLYAMTNVRFKKGMTSVLRRYFYWRM